MEPWLTWTYHYGIGGLLFVVSLVLALRAKALDWKYAPDRRLLLALIAGLVGFMTVHAVWISLAP